MTPLGNESQDAGAVRSHASPAMFIEIATNLGQVRAGKRASAGLAVALTAFNPREYGQEPRAAEFGRTQFW